MNVSNFFQTRVHVVDRGCSSRFTQTSLLTEQYAVHSKLRALCGTNLESSFKILLLFFLSQFGVLQNVFALTRIR